jgi:hypothetical protein
LILVVWSLRLGFLVDREEWEARMRMEPWRQLLALAAIASALTWYSGASAQETTMQGVFHGRGIVKVVEPQTGAMMFAPVESEGFSPALETMYRVSASEVSKFLRPGDTIDFIMDSAEHVIHGAKLLNYEQ